MEESAASHRIFSLMRRAPDAHAALPRNRFGYLGLSVFDEDR